jgi:starch synthase
MKALFISAEAVPFAKVGGMADVVGSLPGALQQAGTDVRVIIPGYGFIPHDTFGIEHAFHFAYAHRRGVTDVHVYTTTLHGIPCFLLQAWPYFGQEESVYTTWDWDVPRFIHFNQIALAATWELGQREGWFPDVIHVHDWHTGLIPFLVAESRWKREWSRVATIMTIHNMAYQGDHAGGFLWNAGVPGRHHPHLLFQGLTDNMLAIGLGYADRISTVSPRYAIEILYPSAGYGLDGLIRQRERDLEGILNGLDYEIWDPMHDQSLAAPYGPDDFENQRLVNKTHLQATCGLAVRPEVPVVGMVTRLAEQKGLDLAVPALRQMLADSDVQVIILGNGEPHIEHAVRQLEHDFPSRACAWVGFNNALSRQIYAGCDIFLMPSRFEPCGMGQMIAMRYGALPLVRETGGLADTVANYDDGAGEHGTGFTFVWEEPEAVLGTLRWALYTYYNRPDAWRRMQRRAMAQDFGWHRSAARYIRMYEQAIAGHE